MPNWTTNNVSFTGDKESIDKIVALVVNEHGDFDFNQIIPMPNSLDIDHSINPTEEEAKIRAENLKLYGYETWWDWRVDMWGTKWNASDCYCHRHSETLFEASFYTPWCAPVPIWRKLKALFPNVKIHWEYSDEDDYEEDENGEYLGPVLHCL